MSEVKGKLVIISGPSGTGKGTIIKNLLELCPDFTFSVSSTTREARPGEIDGNEYNFISQELFEKMILSNDFFEWARYVDNYYGTPKQPIKEYINNGITVILDIEVQGAEQIMKKEPDAISVFIVPPSIDELERRLRGRGTDSEEKLIARLQRAKLELSQTDKYKYVVVNDNAQRAAGEIIEIIRKDT